MKALWVGLFLILALAAGLGDGGLRAQPSEEAASGEAAAEETEEKPFETTKDTIKINFPEMDLESILKNMSAITGKSFLLDQLPKGQVFMIGPIGPIEIPKDEAFNFFVLVLNLSGFQVAPTSIDGVFRVVRSADVSTTGGIEVYPPGRAPETSEKMVMRFIQLDYVSAQDIANQITKLSSKEGGQIIAYQPTNMLIIVDTAYNIKKMIEVIRILDRPSPEPEIEIVQLKYALAQDVASVLGQIFTGSESSSVPRTSSTRDVPRPTRGARPPATPQTAGATVVGGSEAPGAQVKIIPVERTNSLIIIAERQTIEEVKELILQLDVDVGSTSSIHVYYCQNAEASELAGTLSGLSGGGYSSRTSPQAGAVSGQTMTPGMTTQPGVRQPTTRQTTPRARTTTGETSSISGILSGEISITSDDATNALIIVASEHDYEILKEVIDKLDIPRRQVFVEAVLFEVTYNESREAGTSLHAASPLEDDGLVLAGTGLSDVSSIGVLSSLSSGGSLALPNGITMGALAAPVEIQGPTGQVSIPSAGMVVRLLASTSSVNVLSTPTLLTTDNEEASIEVGQKIPVPTGQTVSTGGFSNVSISRESVGIKLKITPQINESDNVRLTIFVEISGAVSSPLGIDVNQLGVTTSIKTAETTVIVKDSQTIVIGGLMEDRQDESQNWVPFLGDIPIIGWLFKSWRRSENKSNLIILLTPHIVKSEQDISRVRNKIQSDYQKMVEEEMLEKPTYVERIFEPEYLPKSEPAPPPPADDEPEPPADNGSSEWRWAEEPEGADADARRASTREAREGE